VTRSLLLSLLHNNTIQSVHLIIVVQTFCQQICLKMLMFLVHNILLHLILFQHSVSAFCFSRASMLMMLLMILIAFLTDLVLTDLIFRIDSDKFVNSLMFKTVLMNSVWWWAQQKLKDFLLHFFIFVQMHPLDCNIVKMCWCLECYIYRNHW